MDLQLELMFVLVIAYLMSFFKETCYKCLWSPTGSHKISLKSVRLKKLSSISFLVEVNHLHLNVSTNVNRALYMQISDEDI